MNRNVMKLFLAACLLILPFLSHTIPYASEKEKLPEGVRLLLSKVPENTLARCSDGIDNDGDGYIDCDDFDCNGLAVCLP